MRNFALFIFSISVNTPQLLHITKICTISLNFFSSILVSFSETLSIFSKFSFKEFKLSMHSFNPSKSRFQTSSLPLNSIGTLSELTL